MHSYRFLFYYVSSEFVVNVSFSLRGEPISMTCMTSCYIFLCLINHDFFFVHTLIMMHLSDCVQFFLLPVVLGTSLLSLGFSNTLFALSFGWYFYITHLGYRGEI